MALAAKSRFSISTLFSLALVLILSFVLFADRRADAQGITGTISGTITDSSGAAIPDATITVTRQQTNESHSVTSSESGAYTAPQLAPGTYSVTVAKAGFATGQQTGIVLQIDQKVDVSSSLKVGSEQTTVDVSAAPSVLQTEDSSIGLVVDAATIQNTPLNSHTSVIGLLQLAPGVQNSGPQDQIPNRGITPSIGSGARNAFGNLNFTLDGSRNLQVFLQRPLAEVPPLDLVSQFKVITTGAPAEFNQPGQVIVVSASGTNALHGELVEYFRGKGTAAKNYSFLGTAAPPRPLYQRNEFGGNITGPIRFPHYDGRNRSFFSFGYEKFLLSQAGVKNTTQPTAQMRSGDFSAYLPANAVANKVKPVVLKDPLTGMPFPGNIIPSSRLNKVDVSLMNLLMPLPTTSTGPEVTNTFEQVPYTQSIHRYFFRGDHSFNSTNQIRGTYMKAGYGPVPTLGPDSLQGGFTADGEVSTYVILGWTHTFSPTLVMDSTVSYTHIPVFRTAQNSKTDFSQIIPGLGPPAVPGAPQITITNIQNIGEAGSRDLEQYYQGITSLVKVAGRHTIKTGISYLFDNHFNLSSNNPARGSYSFNGLYSGVAFADFLLGYPVTTQQPLPSALPIRHSNSEIGAYVQDDFKLTPKLTLNYGLRYDVQLFLDNPYGTNSLWIPGLNKAVVFASSLPAQTIPAYAQYVTLSTNLGLGTSVFKYLGQDINNFAPRFGFAYQAERNTVLRGAFGIYYNLLPGLYQSLPAFSNFPFSAAATFNQPAGSVPTFTMDAPFSLAGAFGANPTINALHSPLTPYTQQYNLALEHQFPLGLGVRVGYVGQSTRKQNNFTGGFSNVTRDLNAVIPAAGAVQPRRPFQPFSTITYAMEPLFSTSMNALQVGVHKQISKGFQLNAEYQWTRVLGTENFQNPFTVNDSYGPIGGLTPQVFTVSYSYELPFGKGRAIGGSLPGVADTFIGGWRLSGITTAQSGQPFSVTYTTSVTGGVGGRANRAPGVQLYPANRTKAQWFNPAAFSIPTSPFTYGNSGYDMLRGPNFQNWDMSLVKNTNFGERYRVQLRAEAFNVFNHPNFGTPNSSLSSPASVGTITSTTGFNRTMQFGAKFNF